MLAPGAGRFLAGPAAVAVALLVLLALGGLPPGPAELIALAAALGLAGFFVVFFRDPERAPGAGIVSAADGRVRAVEVDGDHLRVSVFMNVTNVHVNRFPLAGRVVAISSGGEGYRPAYRADAGTNVQRHYLLATALGEVEVVQITGVVARRLVAFVREGAVAAKADRLGMIVLGSRVDVVLPSARAEATVRVGDRVRAGSSPIARERP